MAEGDFDIADIIADAPAHAPLVALAARHGRAVICQKPMAETLEACEQMVDACREAGVWYAIHENFRYQPPIQRFAALLAEGAVGAPVYADIKLRSPDRGIIEKQPALARMDHMALRDMGPHLFDVARFLFGEYENVYSIPATEYPDMGLSDTACCLLRTTKGLPVHCTLAHAFADKLYVQGDRGSLRLDSDHVIHGEGLRGRFREQVAVRDTLPYIPPEAWALHGGHVFAAIPACLADLLRAYRAGRPAATSGEDNLRTMRLVFGAIRSQDENRVFRLDSAWEA